MPVLSPALLSFHDSGRGCSGSAVPLGWCPAAGGRFSCSWKNGGIKPPSHPAFLTKPTLELTVCTQIKYQIQIYTVVSLHETESFHSSSAAEDNQNRAWLDLTQKQTNKKFIPCLLLFVWQWGREGKGNCLISLLNQPGRQESHTGSSSFPARSSLVSRKQPSSKAILKQRHEVLTSLPSLHSASTRRWFSTANDSTPHEFISQQTAGPHHTRKCFQTASKRRIRSFLSQEFLD